MISQWRLNRFKSVRTATPIQLRPLTVLTGPNSSGKSSLLQSILLIQQTLASKVSRRQLVLNGESVKLGAFPDVLSENAETDEIAIGFTLDLSLSGEVRRRRTQHSLMLFPHYYRFGPGTTGTFNIDLVFGTNHSPEKAAAKSSNLQAELRNATYSTKIISPQVNDETPQRSLIDKANSTVQISQTDPEEIEKLLSQVDSSGNDVKAPDKQALKYGLTSQYVPMTLSRSFRWSRSEVLDPVAVQLDHFLPIGLVNRYVVAARRLHEIVEEEWESFVRRINRQERKFGDVYEKALADVLNELAVSEAIEVQAYIKTKFNTPRRSSSEDLKLVYDQAMTKLDEADRKTVALEIVPMDSTQFLSQAVAQEFASLRYIGPLRDEPKPVYSIANSAEPSHVGYKGEYTAAVLDLYAEQEVDFIPPNGVGGLQQMPLKQAVNEWLKYLDVAESYSTGEEAKLGHRLTVSPGGISKSLDLTNVGVGVSQVLPIIVMALISEQGAILLFEQPELHLHPKVQLRLGDFFLAITAAGRQCIVETHSEYLVNRLRRRIAEAPIERSLREDIALYFVERASGNSRFRLVDIDEYGAIGEWPDDFFDQGPSESDQILAAATAKKQKDLRKSAAKPTGALE